MIGPQKPGPFRRRPLAQRVENAVHRIWKGFQRCRGLATVRPPWRTAMPDPRDPTSRTVPPTTVAAAQSALDVVAYQIQHAAKLLEEVHAGLPGPADIADRQEGLLPYDVATDVLGTIECVLEDNLRPAVESLRGSARVTDADLERDYRERLGRIRL